MSPSPQPQPSETDQAMKKHSGKSSWPKLLDKRRWEKSARSAAVAIETWAADRSKLLLGPKIASGSNSRIHRGMYGEQSVAVKIMHAPQGDDDDDVQGRHVVEAQFDAEVSLLSRLRHPNVVRLVAVCREPEVHWVITELMPRGTLSSYLHGREPYSLPPETVIRLALDVARGMEYLHARGVVHRDLKPENLLLDGGGRVKVADLGTSCLEATCRGDKCSSKAGTFRWMAPEMIHDKRCNRKVDVYSFGLVLWELTTCLVPFQNLSPVQVAYSVCDRDARPPLSPACSPAINSLIERCWSTEPAKRPEFKNIVSVLENYDSCLRQGLPLVPLPEPSPLPSPSPLASLLGAFKIRSCKSMTRSSKADQRVHAYDLY